MGRSAPVPLGIALNLLLGFAVGRWSVLSVCLFPGGWPLAFSDSVSPRPAGPNGPAADRRADRYRGLGQAEKAPTCKAERMNRNLVLTPLFAGCGVLRGEYVSPGVLRYRIRKPKVLRNAPATSPNSGPINGVATRRRTPLPRLWPSNAPNIAARASAIHAIQPTTR